MKEEGGEALRKKGDERCHSALGLSDPFCWGPPPAQRSLWPSPSALQWEGAAMLCGRASALGLYTVRWLHTNRNLSSNRFHLLYSQQSLVSIHPGTSVTHIRNVILLHLLPCTCETCTMHRIRRENTEVVPQTDIEGEGRVIF